MTEHLVTAAELARRLSISRSWVYEHADEPGAIRLGHGRKAPVSFDPGRALASFERPRRAPAPSTFRRVRRLPVRELR